MARGELGGESVPHAAESFDRVGVHADAAAGVEGG